MTNELYVGKETVSTLFSGDRRFEIPEYQRPYNWSEDECTQLWNDLEDFLCEEIGSAKKYANKFYYLGATVTIDPKKNGRLQVIDGQQRMTSLLLLLRAFYRKFRECEADGDKSFAVQIQQISRCIWATNPETGEFDEAKDLRLVSKVQTGDKIKALQHILSTGEVPDKDKSNYAENYQQFYDKIVAFMNNRPGMIRKFCTVILNNCVVFPIQCSEESDALRIFKTLNDRGLELSDSDIFKSHMYGLAKTAAARKKFVSDWDFLCETAAEADLSVDNVFKYYSYFVIGKEVAAAKNVEAKEEGNLGMVRETNLRKFFVENKKRLMNPNLMPDLIDLAIFWKKLGKLHDLKERERDGLLTVRAARYLDCLMNYPNVNWRRVVSVYYLANGKNQKAVKKGLEVFLAKLLSYLCVRYIAKPTVDSIRGGIAEGCAELVRTKNVSKVYSVKAADLDRDTLTNQLKPGMFNSKNKKFVKTLILLNAYLIDAKGKMLITPKFQVEHILPQSWDVATYMGVTEEAARTYIESLGNKMPLGALENIHASDKYFEKKKKHYAASDIFEANMMSKLNQSDWGVDDVTVRGANMTKRLFEFFKKSLSAK